MGSEGKNWLPRAGRQLSQGLASLLTDVGGRRGKTQVASLPVFASREAVFVLGCDRNLSCGALKGPLWEMYSQYRWWTLLWWAPSITWRVQTSIPGRKLTVNLSGGNCLKDFRQRYVRIPRKAAWCFAGNRLGFSIWVLALEQIRGTTSACVWEPVLQCSDARSRCGALPWPHQFYYHLLAAFLLSKSLICCQLPKYNECVLQWGWGE